MNNCMRSVETELILQFYTRACVDEYEDKLDYRYKAFKPLQIQIYS